MAQQFGITCYFKNGPQDGMVLFGSLSFCALTTNCIIYDKTCKMSDALTQNVRVCVCVCVCVFVCVL